MDALLTRTIRRPAPEGLSRRDFHVDQAPQIVAGFVAPLDGSEIVRLRRAAGRVLAADIRSAAAVPPFDHAAVDGYGVRSGDTAAPNASLKVTARILAGEKGGIPLSNSAVRIMTGAPIPPGCNAVVKQEHTVRDRDLVTITDAVRGGANIRRTGEDVAAGDTIVRQGSVLDARHIALLAACGVDKVPVAPRIRVAIAAFGRELRRPGSRLQPGQIFDSNTAMASSFFSRPSCRIVECVRADDDLPFAAALLRDLEEDADLIVTSGGMAGGDEDHTTGAIERAGGSWRRVAFNMRPGKPARLGRLGRSVVLGLPGNPFAALVALTVLGLPVLGALSGGARPLRWLPARAGFDLERSGGRTEFFPARAADSEACGTLTLERLGKGGSARLHPLVHADGLGRIDSRIGNVVPGDSLLFLPFSAIVGGI